MPIWLAPQSLPRMPASSRGASSETGASPTACACHAMRTGAARSAQGVYSCPICAKESWVKLMLRAAEMPSPRTSWLVGGLQVACHARGPVYGQPSDRRLSRAPAGVVRQQPGRRRYRRARTPTTLRASPLVRCPPRSARGLLVCSPAAAAPKAVPSQHCVDPACCSLIRAPVRSLGGLRASLHRGDGLQSCRLGRNLLHGTAGKVWAGECAAGHLGGYAVRGPGEVGDG